MNLPTFTHHSRRGSTMIPTVLLVFTFAALSATMVTSSLSQMQSASLKRELLQARSEAENGVTIALHALRHGVHPDGAETITINESFTGFAFQSVPGDELAERTATHCVNVYPGDLDCVDNNGDGQVDELAEATYLLIDSLGMAGPGQRAVRTLRVTVAEGTLPFRNAIYAGNSSKDPNYVLPIGGTTSGNSDQVVGNVYSGEDARVEGWATVDGIVRAGGDSTVGDYATVSQGDISDFDGTLVPLFERESFTAHRGFTEVNESNWGGHPAQDYLQLNPSNRTTETAPTPLPDFFFEAPSYPSGTAYNAPIDIPSGGNDAIVYVDGNLWVHHLDIYGFDLGLQGGGPARVTMVVAGNVYLSDNIEYAHPESQLAILAIENPSLPESTRGTDSGNIIIGDSRYGTLEDFSGLLYAQNDFIDNNLSASGSAEFIIRGSMTARDQVNINRDFGSHHAKMTVIYDERVLDPDFQLAPGIESLVGLRTGGKAYDIVGIERIGTATFEWRDSWELQPNRSFGGDRTDCEHVGDTGETPGGSTGGSTGGETGGETGGSTGGSTGGETGGSTGGETGGTTGGETTGGETGGSTGGETTGGEEPEEEESGSRWRRRRWSWGGW